DAPRANGCARRTVARNALRTHRGDCVVQLLPRVAPGHGRGGAGRGAPGVDVQAAAPGVTGFHRELPRLAAAQQVDEDLFDALFVETCVLAERDQIAQQAGAGDARTAIGDLDRGPRRLAGDRAGGLEQFAAQRLVGVVAGVGAQQAAVGRAVAVDLHVQRVDADGVVIARQRRQAEPDFDRPAGCLREVVGNAHAHALAIVETAGVERVEVELERL